MIIKFYHRDYIQIDLILLSAWTIKRYYYYYVSSMTGQATQGIGSAGEDIDQGL